MVPEGWQLRNLAELLERCDYGLSCALNTDPSGVPILRMGNLQEGRVLLADLKYVSESQVQEHDLLRASDILVNRTNSPALVGKTGLFEGGGRMTFASYLFRLRTLPGVEPAWLAQVLVSSAYQSQLRGIATPGVSQANINRQKLLAMSVLSPPIEEQKKIAAVLSSVGDAIDSTQLVIDQLQVVKQAMMAELFGRGLPGRHTTFKETVLGELPESWMVLPFGDLLPDGTLNGLYKSSEFFGSGVPLLDMGDLFRTEIVEHRERRRVRLTEQERIRFQLQQGDLLFARRSLKLEGSGQCALVPPLPEYPVCESSIIRARLDQARCVPGFYLHFWNGAIGRRLRMSIARQVAVSGISAADLVGLRVPVPPLDEQRVIAGIINEIDQRVAQERTAVAQLRLLKSALSSALLTGEIRVTPTPEAP